jgi:16S rRNA (guanine527-N7)-methyltransferase
MAIVVLRPHTRAVSTARDTPPDSALKRVLEEGLGALGLPVDERLAGDLLAFQGLLAQWNRAFNLTAVRGPEDMVVRHLLDSLSIQAWIPPGRIADIGTGAGLPGIPLALALPDRSFVLVDSVGKKVRFVRQACRDLGLSNVIPVQSRLEDYRPEQTFDAVVARALAPLERLAPLAAPLLTPGGRLLAMSGRHPGHPPAPEGFDTLEVHGVKVPHLDAPRHLVVLKRESR